MADQAANLPPGFTPTQWREPKTGDKQLRVVFRNGQVSKHTYTARQLVWDDRSADVSEALAAWDVVAAKFEKGD